MKLMWFRHDLRVTDNLALATACAESSGPGELAAVYIWCDELLRRHDTASLQQQFIAGSVRELALSLASFGIELQVLTVNHWQDIAQSIVTHAVAISCDSVFFNDEYGVDEQNRDLACQRLAGGHGIHVRRYCGRLLLAPGSVLTQNQTPFSVFTPFSRAALRQLPFVYSAQQRTVNNTLPEAWRQQALTVETRLILPDIAPYKGPWGIGEKAAQNRLMHFLHSKLPGYTAARDAPAQDIGSGLSPYLAAGVLGPWQIYDALARARKPVNDASCKAYINELLWRDFYAHLMAQVPRLSMHKPWLLYTDWVPWRHDQSDFQRWCDGQTGIPIVDAGMRQLRQTGFMHNRVRMIVASFLCKNLLIDWRWGERFFKQHLLDGEFASNNGGWQWAASTGTDASPYFRVFNAHLQAEKHDPKGEYIRRYVPELQQMTHADLFGGERTPDSVRNYPAPMVDLKSSRVRAIAAFKAAQQHNHYRIPQHEHA